jgi:single-strand binding protein
MFNKTVLVGNLTRDVELRYASNGNAIGNSAIAVSRKYTNNNGAQVEEVMFIDITFFGKIAEVANQYLRKGSKLLVEGRLKFDQWTDNNGQNRSKHTVVIENMEMLGSPQNQQQQGGNAGANGYAQPQQQGYAPQQAGYAQPQQGYAPAPQQAPQQRATQPAQRQAAAPQQQRMAQPAQQQQYAAAPAQQQAAYAAPQAEAAYQQHQYQEIPEIDVNEDMQGNEEIPF